uniref:Uncharacterized protein n=1 Tax=Oryza barthii TaxID=65489 RepID=A0A0D3G4T8_9ORYZ
MESERRGRRRGNRRWGRCGSQKRGLGGAEGGRGEADLACDVARHRRGGEAELWRRVVQEDEAKRDAAWMRCDVDAVGGGGVRRHEMRERGGAMQERGVDACGPAEQRNAGEERRGAMLERRWGR